MKGAVGAMGDEPKATRTEGDGERTGWRALWDALVYAVTGLGELFSALLEPFQWWR